MRPHSERLTEVFIHLPSGPTSVRELREALARLVAGVPGWSDVRVTREAMDVLEAYARGDLP
jgi:hypothetical protein